MAELRWGSATHEGQVRDANEDYLSAGERLFVVADGMGGHLAGEVASELAVTTLDQRAADDLLNTLDDLVTAIADANTSIYDDAGSHSEHAGMGTTVTAIAVVDDPYDGESFGIANVGDSRIYLLRHGRLRQVTIDHSFVQELVAEGAITRDEARHHPRRNIVTRGLGIEPVVRVDSWTMPIVRHDRFVLCSDGLSDYVHDDDINEILQRHGDDPQAAADELVDAANDAGGPDNITVVVVDVLEGDEPPDPTEEFDIIPAWDDSDEHGRADDTGETHVIADPLPSDSDDTADQDGTETAPPADESADDGDTTVADDTAVVAAAAGHGTTDADSDAAPTTTTKSSRLGRFVGFALTVGVIAVIVGSFTLLAAWARSGYFVDFDDEGVVYVYQGRPEPVLWFQPTPEAPGAFTRDELTERSIELVEERPEFSTLESAVRWVSDRLEPQPVDDTEDDQADDGASGDTTTDTTAPARATDPTTSTTESSTGG